MRNGYSFIEILVSLILVALAIEISLLNLHRLEIGYQKNVKQTLDELA